MDPCRRSLRSALLAALALALALAGPARAGDRPADPHARTGKDRPAGPHSRAGRDPPRPRARDLGIPFAGTPGPLDAITDVPGVQVGHTTLISGGTGDAAVRTGVTAILPRGGSLRDPVFGGWFSLNGNGEMTGTAWLDDSGFLDGPVLLTNTHSVGTVRDAVIAWRLRHGPPDDEGYYWSLPVVAETWDGYLNDIDGFHVRPEHVFHALETARSGPVPEGNVGGGTGMVCHEWKGGIGTASRQVGEGADRRVVGVLVQCNYGVRRSLRVAGVPVGEEIPDHTLRDKDVGSIVIVVATDAPLLPHQLRRLARRAALGLARNGSFSGNGSGDLFLAFSTANPGAARVLGEGAIPLRMLPNPALDPLFEATVQATEEAIINALVAAESMTGLKGHSVSALPHDRLLQVLRKYNRLSSPAP